MIRFFFFLKETGKHVYSRLHTIRESRSSIKVYFELSLTKNELPGKTCLLSYNVSISVFYVKLNSCLSFEIFFLHIRLHIPGINV